MNIEILAGLGSAIVALFKGMTLVKEGQLGSKTTFGRAVRGSDNQIKVVKPGFVFLLPFVNSMQKAHIRMDSLELNDLNVTLKNKLSYHYSCYVAYHVSNKPEDLEKFLYKVENAQELISQKLSSQVRELLTEIENPEDAKGEEINKKLTDLLEIYLLEKIGVILDSCGLTSFTESAQAQQVNVTKAKIEYAKTIYKEEDKIPETVVAAAFGATPTVSPTTIIQKEHQKKKESFWFSVKKDNKEESEG